MFGRSTAAFDRVLEKATSQLLLEPDWTSNLMICDSIRQGDTNPKYAVNAIKKKFYHQNPHAALFALQVMESCVKNCGDLIHAEIATKAFMAELRDLVKQTTDDNIKEKVLELIQTWGTVFRNSPKYRIVTDTLNLMQAEGWKFPPVREAEAMFEADTAPEWAEGDVCHRCRVQFSTFTRQHHCRACGQVFCGKCSSKSCLLPKFGIEREVRVCDSCFANHGPKEEDSPTHQSKQGAASASSGLKDVDLPEEYLSSTLAKQSQEPATKGGKSEAELKEEEEEELQLVLALSKSEAEEKEKIKKKATSDILAGLENHKNKVLNGSVKSPEESDPELSKYLNREYWEEKKEDLGSNRGEPDRIGMTQGVVQEMPSAVLQAKQDVLANPVARDEDSLQGAAGATAEIARADNAELDEFTTSHRTQLEIFVNRMKSNSSRGRPISTDSSVQSLFINMMTMHARLVKYIQEQEDARVHYEGLQDKLNQVKDARAALDALREEERERRRCEAEEAERLRQIQMAQKLEQMRKKKAEYLEYQRQMAMKRMADQELAMMADASRHSYLHQQHNPQNIYLPYSQPGYPPQHHPTHAMHPPAAQMPPQTGQIMPPAGGANQPGLMVAGQAGGPMPAVTNYHPIAQPTHPTHPTHPGQQSAAGNGGATQPTLPAPNMIEREPVAARAVPAPMMMAGNAGTEGNGAPPAVGQGQPGGVATGDNGASAPGGSVGFQPPFYHPNQGGPNGAAGVAGAATTGNTSAVAAQPPSSAFPDNPYAMQSIAGALPYLPQHHPSQQQQPQHPGQVMPGQANHNMTGMTGMTGMPAPGYSVGPTDGGAPAPPLNMHQSTEEPTLISFD